MESCAICERVRGCAAGHHPWVIRELETSWLVLGDHQVYPGYSLLLLKTHAREPHELETGTQAALFRDLMKAGEAISWAFKPWKLNYASLGNQDPHVHWHLFPRYENDPERRGHPWVHSAEFALPERRGTDQQRADAVARIQAELGRA